MRHCVSFMVADHSDHEPHCLSARDSSGSLAGQHEGRAYCRFFVGIGIGIDFRGVWFPLVVGTVPLPIPIIGGWRLSRKQAFDTVDHALRE